MLVLFVPLFTHSFIPEWNKTVPCYYLLCHKIYFQLKKLFKVIWKNENNPVEGFDGLYLTNDDAHALQQIVATHRRNGFYQIDGIIGKEVHIR